MFMKKKVHINSLSNLKPHFSKWKNPDTKTIRVPKNLAEDIIKYAFILDNIHDSNEKFHLLPIEKIYLKLDEIYHSKKSLKRGIDRFKNFIDLLVKESPI